jgi:hypothetical protein
MISTMAGCGVPALELFARFDANNPTPPGWDLWGNQAAQSNDSTDTSSPDESPPRDAERLWLHPAIAGKHVVSMTRDYLDGEEFKVATCQCGWKTYSRAGIERPIDDQINGHWRARILASEAFAEPADEKVGGVAGACSALVSRREPDESLSREDEQIADSGKGDAFASDRPAAPAATPTPDDRIVDTVADETPIRSEAAAPPVGRPGPEIPLSELDELRTVWDPTIPGRAEILERVGKDLAARGLAYRPVSNGDWVLSIKGRDRFRELGGELKTRKPAPAIEPHPLDIPAFLRRTVKGQFEMDLSTSDRAAPEVVDGKLQTRLPLTEGELEEQAAMLALKAEKKINSEMLRHLVGRDFAWCAPSGRVHITDSGHAFLAQLVTPAPAAEIEAST